MPPLDDLWRPRKRLISTSLAAFDAPPHDGWSHVVHVGPALEDEKFAVRIPLPWRDDDERPLALVSFSTGFEQRNVDKVQRTLDALADAPLRVVATTGGIVAPNEVAAPANAIVLDYAAHARSWRAPPSSSAMAVTARRCGRCATACHGDHPRRRRRPALRRRSDRRMGSGRRPARRRAARAIRDAVGRLIADPRYRAEARRRAEALDGVDGARGAADEVEATLAN